MIKTFTNDLDLLREFVRDQSQDAFTALVHRHVALVYSAALRQVRSPQLAEEVSQSVFVDLARVAVDLTPDTILPAWLYQVTRRAAIDVVRKESRRQLRERIAANDMIGATACDWIRIEPLLDEAMHTLDEPDRVAILLRFFEDKSLREVGEALGITDDTARKRVNRALERLRDFFSKRGIAVTATSLSMVIASNAVQAAPEALALTISTAVALSGACSAAITTKALAMTTTQKVLITAAITAAVATGVYQAHQSSVFQTEVEAHRQQKAALSEQWTRERDDFSGQLGSLRNENERLKREGADLMRLRAEVSRLRQELSVAAKSADVGDQASGPEEERQPVSNFVAVAETIVPAGETLALGGWTTAPGKRTLAFVKPGVLETNGAGKRSSIKLEGRFVEFAEEMLASIASDLDLPNLGKLKTEGRQSLTHDLFSADETAKILQLLESNARTFVIRAPEIAVGDAPLALTGTTERKTIDGKEYELGPSLVVHPEVSSDGSSVRLLVTARVIAVNPD